MKTYETEGMSDKAKAFIVALELLCIEHQVQLAVTGYDGLSIWNSNRLTDEPLYVNGIEDKTTNYGYPILIIERFS